MRRSRMVTIATPPSATAQRWSPGRMVSAIGTAELLELRVEVGELPARNALMLFACQHAAANVMGASRAQPLTSRGASWPDAFAPGAGRFMPSVISAPAPCSSRHEDFQSLLPPRDGGIERVRNHARIARNEYPAPLLRYCESSFRSLLALPAPGDTRWASRLVYWYIDALPELLSGKSSGGEVLHSVRRPLPAPMPKVRFREPLRGQVLRAMRSATRRYRADSCGV
jgi:hypothetical protein